ncbi:major facilitator superfamily-domain-containing protein [Fusarium oxysporum II5]|nr:major facilitator superfamily-domain-containing protein [Fusarium oxysporum II5]
MAIPSSRQRLVVSIYNISTGSVMLLWGRLADVYGRRLGFLSVSAIFTLSTMFLPWSTYEIPFYVLRAVQGMSAAAIMPSGIGIVASTFAPGPSRNMPFITMSAMASLSSVVGSLLGGFVRTSLGWKWFFGSQHKSCYARTNRGYRGQQEAICRLDWRRSRMVSPPRILFRSCPALPRGSNGMRLDLGP